MLSIMLGCLCSCGRASENIHFIPSSLQNEPVVISNSEMPDAMILMHFGSETYPWPYVILYSNEKGYNAAVTGISEYRRDLITKELIDASTLSKLYSHVANEKAPSNLLDVNTRLIFIRGNSEANFYLDSKQMLKFKIGWKSISPLPPIAEDYFARIGLPD